MGYTKDDTIFKSLVKNGSGIITKAKLEQAKIPNAEVGNWKLLDSVDIDWNGARLSYVYDATGADLNDSSDLLYLIDEISHGNAIAWEEYSSHEDVNPPSNEIWYWGEYYDLENAISVLSDETITYAGPAILSNERVGDKYVITFDGPVTKLGAVVESDELVELYPIFANIPDMEVECNITRVEIPNSITNIGESAFTYCISLTSINIPNTVTSIGVAAFQACISLTSVTISNSVTSIGEYAFGDCSGLTSVVIPESVTSIGTGAFDGCSGLTSPVYNAHLFVFMPRSYSGTYTIENGIESIAGGAFRNCISLSSIDIPNSVTSIGDTAFDGCNSLTSVNISNSVTSIGYRAFYGCSSLTSINIPDSVTSIGNYAFHSCTGLTSVTIGNNATSIEEYAFYGCSGLTSVTIPNSVTSIGEWAFSYCSSLTSITCEALIPPTLGNDVFDSTNNCPIYVPTDSVDIYQTNWSTYAFRIQAIPTE